jgi:hypothetical protein
MGMSMHIGFYGRKGSFNVSKPQDVASNSTSNCRLDGSTKDLPQLWLDIFLKLKAFSAQVCVIVVCVVINFCIVEVFKHNKKA